MSDEIKILSERKVYENSYGSLFDDDVCFTNNSSIGTYVRWQWKAPYSVAILPFVSKNEAVFVESFRHSARKVTVEVPKGFGEINVEPIDIARNELLEETGLKSDYIEYVGETICDPAFAYQPMHLFVAQNCKFLESHHEMSEVILGLRTENISNPAKLLESGITDTTSLLLVALAFDKIRHEG